ncbi:MAG TPA: hypothetical protein VK550_06275 [Polyangiaceae bacterium]|nr:hypothetical protein [Polyangiaceae bacterium]
MSNPPFDASKAVTFDLSRGQIQKDGTDPRWLVSASAVIALCRDAGGEAASTFARATGQSMGAAIAARFERAGGDVSAAAIDAVFEHLSGELAVAGFGRLSIERWGQALVLVLDHSPASESGDELVRALLGAAVAGAAKLDLECVRLAREGERARFFIAGRRGAEKVRQWLGSGVSWGEAIVRLHPAQPSRGDA